MLVASAVTLALGWSTVSGPILKPLLASVPTYGVPYLRAGLATIGDLLVLLGLVSVAAMRSPASILRFAGFDRDARRPLLWGLASLTPSAVLAFWFAPLGQFEVSDLLYQAIGSPVLEEIIYRGLAIGILMRLCGWPFLAAALLPATLFGLAHAAQGEAPIDIAGLVAITGFGGLLFGWLFVRWGFNLWPSILLHVGMNALWIVFNLGDNAIGSWFGNALRLLVIALAISLTLLLAPRSPMQNGGS